MLWFDLWMSFWKLSYFMSRQLIRLTLVHCYGFKFCHQSLYLEPSTSSGDTPSICQGKSLPTQVYWPRTEVYPYDMLYSGSAGPIVHPPSALWHVEAGAGRVWPMCVGTRWPRQLLTRTTVTRTPGLLWTGYIVVTTPVILPRAGHTWGMYHPYSMIFKCYSFYASRFFKEKVCKHFC